MPCTQAKGCGWCPQERSRGARHIYLGEPKARYGRPCTSGTKRGDSRCTATTRYAKAGQRRDGASTGDEARGRPGSEPNSKRNTHIGDIIPAPVLGVHPVTHSGGEPSATRHPTLMREIETQLPRLGTHTRPIALGTGSVACAPGSQAGAPQGPARRRFDRLGMARSRNIIPSVAGGTSAFPGSPASRGHSQPSNVVAGLLR